MSRHARPYGLPVVEAPRPPILAPARIVVAELLAELLATLAGPTPPPVPDAPAGQCRSCDLAPAVTIVAGYGVCHRCAP